MISSQRLLAAAFALTLAAGPAFAEDEPQSFNAFSMAVANGTIVKSAEKQVMIVGTIAGPMFIETDEGPVAAGRMTCAASVRVDQETQHQAGSGACTFTAEDGATAWGSWECAGYALVGCRGQLTLNGGSQRLAGVSGGGSMIWRPSGHELIKQLDGTVLQNTAGIVVWRDFKLSAKK